MVKVALEVHVWIIRMYSMKFYTVTVGDWTAFLPQNSKTHSTFYFKSTSKTLAVPYQNFVFVFLLSVPL